MKTSISSYYCSNSFLIDSLVELMGTTPSTDTLTWLLIVLCWVAVLSEYFFLHQYTLIHNKLGPET